jgi:hypothetical protein
MQGRRGEVNWKTGTVVCGQDTTRQHFDVFINGQSCGCDALMITKTVLSTVTG